MKFLNINKKSFSSKKIISLFLILTLLLTSFVVGGSTTFTSDPSEGKPTFWVDEPIENTKEPLLSYEGIPKIVPTKKVKITMDKIMTWIMVGTIVEILNKNNLKFKDIDIETKIDLELGFDCELKIKGPIKVVVSGHVDDEKLKKIKEDVISAIRDIAKIMTFDKDDEEKLRVTVTSKNGPGRKTTITINIDAHFD